MGYKSRAHWASACIRPCANRDKKCKDCLRFDQWKPRKPIRKKWLPKKCKYCGRMIPARPNQCVGAITIAYGHVCGGTRK